MLFTSRIFKWHLLIASVLICACAVKPAMLKIEGHDQPLAPGAILNTATGETINFDQLIEQLIPAGVIYVGERHTATEHHKAQLQIIRALNEKKGRIRVGMEIFDHTYQSKLDQWSAGKLGWSDFLKQTHWYANWRFDDTLYKAILEYVKAQQLILVGINIPFNLPPKIAVGGLESLSKYERALLPKAIDTSQEDHRAYVEEIFKGHTIRGRDNFENFYAAQCAWEDGMASAVANHKGPETTVVVVGNGHITRKFGIPNRAFARNPVPFRTVYLATPNMGVSHEDGDFIWVMPEEKPTMHGMMKRKKH